MSKVQEINPREHVSWREWRAAWKEAADIKPKQVNPLSARTAFYKDYLWRLFKGTVQLDVPETWSREYVMRALFLGGSFAVTRYQGAVIPATFTVDNRNAWDYPITCRSEDKVRFGERTIGKDAEIVFLETSYDGIRFLAVSEGVDIYASRLADIDAAVDINLINSRSAYIAQATDSAEASTFKALFTKIFSGEPAIIWRKNSKRITQDEQPIPITALPVKNNYIADALLDAKTAVVNEFLTMYGVNNSTSQKQERMLVDEVNSNNEMIDCAVNEWQHNVDMQLEKVRKMFPEVGEKLSIKFEVKTREHSAGGVENESNRTGGNVGANEGKQQRAD